MLIPPIFFTGAQKFLGLGLVGIDELSSGPASTQILELQPRPYETENITGTLTIEVWFLDIYFQLYRFDYIFTIFFLVCIY